MPKCLHRCIRLWEQAGSAGSANQPQHIVDHKLNNTLRQSICNSRQSHCKPSSHGNYQELIPVVLAYADKSMKLRLKPQSQLRYKEKNDTALHTADPKTGAYAANPPAPQLGETIACLSRSETPQTQATRDSGRKSIHHTSCKSGQLGLPSQLRKPRTPPK